MSDFKISDIAAKLGRKKDELLNEAKEKGVAISEGDTVTEAGAKSLGADPKLLKLDKRQEMLKKAMERHKRHPRAREVKVQGGEDGSSVKKVSKEDLINRKKALEKSIQKVDELRENAKSNPVEENQSVAETKPEQPVQQAPRAEEVVSAKIEAKPVAETVDQKPKVKDEAPVAETEKPRSEAQASNNKNSGQQRGGQQRDGQSRPPREGGYQQRDGQSRPPREGGYQQRDGQSRDGGRGGYQQRDGQSRDGGRGGYQQRDGRGGPGGRPGGAVPTPVLDDSLKKLRDKEKEKEREKEKEAIAAKEAKKKARSAAKKDKSFHKVIDEGFDELTLEKEIVEGVAAPEPVEVEEVAVKETKKPIKKGRDNKKKRRGGRSEEPKPVIRPSSIQVGEHILVGELAKLLGVKATEIIKNLMNLGIMASVNQAIDGETAHLIGAEYGVEVNIKFLTEDDLLQEIVDKDEDQVSRPPIVAVMGHVDHGKTSLLDAIRKTSVAEREAGGITQHIGAYEVDIDHGKIVFLDTPGHEAFTTLRARGAQVTDIVILLVAADDGVMPQTKEAIDHVQAAGVRMIVAINKIDKPNANIDMVRSQLAELNIMSEEWGGEYQFQEISAKNNIGIEDLLERVLLEAEMLELKGNPDRLAEGVVIESKLDKQKGPVATILVHKGTLKKGDNFVVGSQYGKVRAMFNYKGMSVKEAGLSIPVEIMGFSGVPVSGDKFIATVDEKTAKQVASLRDDKKREAALMEKTKVSLADLFDRIKEGELQELNVVLKADVQGSLEALKSSLLKLSNTEIKIKILHANVGGISENDIILAAASNALVFGFNVRPDANARAKADQEGVDINLYSVIYQIIDDVKQAMEGMLTPDTKEEVIGRVEIRQVFSVPKIGKIAGCFVVDGKVTRASKVRIVRNSIVIYDGTLSSLRRFQDDAKEVTVGYECGIGIDKYNDLKEGDMLEVYQLVEEKRTLEDVRKAEEAATAAETKKKED